jgi:hypothetical protein
MCDLLTTKRPTANREEENHTEADHGIAYYTGQAYVTIGKSESLTTEEYPMSLTDELRQIQTLSDGIVRMAAVATATGIMPSDPSLGEERARDIREQLTALRDEITHRLQQRIHRSPYQAVIPPSAINRRDPTYIL